jgi:1-acyl-sn-glycerol-3-phosphate acyltransferase
MSMRWQMLGSDLPRTSNPLTQFVGRTIFSMLGWNIEGNFPNRPKIVVALVPHTSNMDFLLTVAVLWGLGLKSAFLMKHSLFWFPLGKILRALGGIPVDRGSPQGMVGQMTAEFERRSKLVLGITPEGTRGAARGFKQGFARIAESAQVPVLPAILDYKARTVRFGALIENVTDVEATVKKVQQESASGVARH